MWSNLSWILKFVRLHIKSPFAPRHWNNKTSVITIGTTGPEFIYLINLGKNGLPAKSS